MPKTTKILIVFLVLSGSFIVAALLFFWFQIRIPLDPEGQARLFKIETGTSARGIANLLEKEGLIKSAFYFRLYTIFSLQHKTLKRGEYELSSRQSIREIADLIFEGRKGEVRVTIPEGFNLKEVDEAFAASGLLRKGALLDFQLDAEKFSRIMDGGQTSLEGYLFPDTYNFFRDADVETVVNKMVGELDKKIINQMLADIKGRKRTFFEVLIIASLIEKEVRTDPDRQIVSGILWKRLSAGMPLQVDATLVYITGRKTIYEADKKIESPYNTYFYLGLPKGPIANPGLASIIAAVYPKESPYWYYLNSRDGKTVYSVTLEEHNRAKVIYLRASSKNQSVGE